MFHTELLAGHHFAEFLAFDDQTRDKVRKLVNQKYIKPNKTIKTLRVQINPNRNKNNNGNL